MHAILCSLLLLLISPQTQNQPPQTPVTAPTSAPAATQPTAPKPAAATDAPKAGGDYWIRVTADAVNVRDEPNTDTSLRIRQFDKGTVLRARKEEGGWHAIHAVPGTVCLVSKQYVSRSAGANEGVVSVTSSPLMVRSESAISTTSDPTKNKVIARMPNGAVVRILGEREGWYEIAPPAGVNYYISAEFAERISDEQAAQATPQIGETSPGLPVTSVDAHSPASSPATAEGGLPPLAASRPAGGSAAGLNGPWAERYRVVEASVQTEMAKPELERGIESMIFLLRPIADQREEREVATLAERRIALLQPELEKQASAREAAAEAMRRERAVQASQPAEEGPPRRDADHPSTPSDLDFRGVLRPTFRVPVSSNGLRYALIDPASKEVRCYIEIPWDLKIDLKTATGRFVGVRGERLFEADYGAPLLRASYMVILTQEKPTPAPRQ